MKATVHPCDDSRLTVLLRGDESSAEYAAASSHVETCTACQQRLSTLAAAAGEWEETRELLRVSEGDAELTEERKNRPWNNGGGRRAASWTEELARQLLQPPSHPEMLGRLGRYEIERLIGSGGMGIVFKGFDTELNRPVAIKVLAPHLATSGAARQRFAREAKAAAAVVHEHVVAIHNVETDATAPFLVMQFVAGESLQARIDRQGPLELCEILRIAHQTAAGLAAAHAQGLVHRDVKPSNILLEQGLERALLTDFGLARASDDASLTYTGHALGTPHYMSPEQARGDAVDSASDLFSLGSVIYAMCTGRPPFRAETAYGVLRRITDSEARPIRETNPQVPAWLDALVQRLLHKSPKERLGSADELADVLAQCLAHVQQPTATPLPAVVSKLAPTSKPISPRNWLLVAVPALALAAAGILLQVNWPKQPAGSSATTTLPGAAASADPALDWNDGAAEKLQSLGRDLDNLEPRAQRLWDVESMPQTERGDNR
jgi:serine/threonine protein kinase